MSLEEKLVAWADRFSDHLNPILVKEARQALKSRQFVVTFMLLLLIAWLVSVVGVTLAGPAIEYGSPGRYFVMFFVFVLQFAVHFIVPFTAFRSMQVENELSTFELLSISNLSPKSIVLGKLGSAVVQVFLFYSAIAPFIAFTSLLQGFDLPNTIFLLVSNLFWSIFACLFSIMLSSISHGKQWATLNTLGVLGLLFWQTCGSFAFASAVMFETMPFDSSEFWWGCLAGFVAYMGFVHLLQKIAESRLTFESDNRSTGIRLACLYLLVSQWLMLGAYGLYAAASSSVTLDWTILIPLTFISALFVGVMGLFAATELDYMSRRVRRQIPSGGLLALGKALLLPGGARGYAYFLALLGAIALVSNSLWITQLKATRPGEQMVMNGLMLYAVIYVSFGAAIGRWMQLISAQVKPAHCRVIVLMVAIISMMVPYIPLILGTTTWSYGYSLMDVTNPFSTLHYMDQNPNQPLSMIAFAMLAAAAVLGLVVNLWAMFKGVFEVVNYRSTQARSVPVAQVETFSIETLSE